MMKVPEFMLLPGLKKRDYTGADLMDGGTGGFHLLGFIQSYKNVIIIDASLDQFPAGHVRVLASEICQGFSSPA